MFRCRSRLFNDTAQLLYKGMSGNMAMHLQEKFIELRSARKYCPTLPWRLTACHSCHDTCARQPDTPSLQTLLHCSKNSRRHQVVLRASNSTAAASQARSYSKATTSHQGPQEVEVAVTTLPQYCSGCGVKLQASDPSLPGYVSAPYLRLFSLPTLSSCALPEMQI